MKTHTSQFKEDIKTIGKQLDSKITFKVDGVTQTLTSEDLNGVTPTFQGAILKSVMKELDIDSNVNIPIGTEVNYQFGVKLEGNFEYLDYGNYIVYSSKKQEDTSSYKIICYDKMLYSMKQNEDLGITYPISIRDYINALCTKIGLEFKNKNDEFANFDRVLDKELYVGLDYTYRDILDELAQVTASTICLNSEDKVEIRYINDLTELNEVVGTNININDSIDYKLNSLTLYGKSTQATSTNPVSPSPDFPSPIESITEISATVTGKNLFDISKVISNWNSSTNIGIKNNNDGTLTVSAPSTSSSVQELAPNKLSDYCPNLKVGDVVYLNATTTGTQKYIYLITSASVWSFGSSARTITQNDLDSGVLWYSSGVNTTATISDIMISTDGGEYEQYKSNSLTIDLQGNELCSLPNGTKDELVIENGEALLIKKIRHITRAIADMNNNDAYPGWTNETQLKEDYPNKNVSFLTAGINIRSNITNNAKYIGLNTNESGVLMFFKNLFNNMTQTEIKANYPDLVLDLYYELAEPETINLGTVEMPHTYEGVSNITNSADTEMIVKYSKGWETINEEYLKDINVNFG